MRSTIVLALFGGVILSILSICLLPAQRDSADSVVTMSETILVAKKDILPGERLSSENVALKHWPIARIPEGSATQLTDLEGQVPSTHIYSGEAVPLAQLCSLDCLVVNPDASPRFLVASVLVRDDAESRRVLAGDRVDVLAIPVNERDERATDARTVLRNATVFANLEPESDDGQATVRSISLRFDPTQTGHMELLKFTAGVDGPLLVRQVGSSSASDDVGAGDGETETTPVSVSVD